jgi:PPOX class probable F420-dependent enzyme
MADLTDFDVELLRGRNFAHVATARTGAPPHVTVTWVHEQDGFVLVNGAEGRVKDRHLRRDPLVSITIHAQDDPYRWVGIDGTVAEFVMGDEADRSIDFLNRKYHDGEPWTFVPGQRRVLYRIRPDRIVRHED